jgi:prepilin-type N-terminal cleavage/methylation domain-containing protein
MKRRGFSLVELMVALVIAGVVGVALTRLVISQARLLSLQDATMQARAGIRAALLTAANEMRPVALGGVVQAARESVTVRIPFAMGIACRQVSGTTVVAVLPTDSSTFAGATPGGYAWRDSLGTFTWEDGATIANPNANLADCTGATPSVRVLSGAHWSARAVSVSPNRVATQVGAPVILYRIIRYAFAPSSVVPGATGLWRTDLGTGVREEMSAPYDPASEFNFVVGPAQLIQSVPPANLTDLYGVRMDAIAVSERPPQGKSTPLRFNFVTAVVFRNVPAI